MSTSSAVLLVESSGPQAFNIESETNFDSLPVLSASQASWSSLATTHDSSVAAPGISGSYLLNDLKQNASQPHLSAHPLGESASVDSFTSQRSLIQPEAAGKILQHLDASMNSDGAPQILSSPPSGLSLSGLFRSKVGRRRGASIGTTDNETSAQEESDFDKSSTTSKMKGRVRARLLSFKSSRALGSGSEARDSPRQPTRLSARGTSASLSNLKVSNLSMSRLPPKPSSPLSDSAQAISKEMKRARSQSVGPPSRSTSSKIAKRLSLGNQSATPGIAYELAIAVIGPTGCGKSTFIRKSLKRRNLSNTESFVATISVGDMTRNITYTCRRARLLSELNTLTLLSVYECDTQDWKIDGINALISVWPSSLPRVDGIFVCYDESNVESFKHVIQLLAGYKNLNIPTLVLAYQYTKIIEVSQYSDEGKGRMRKAVDVLIRQITAPQSERSIEALPSRSEKAKALTLTVRTGISPSTIDLASPTSSLVPSPVRPLPRSPSHTAVIISPSQTLTKKLPARAKVSDSCSLPYESDKEQIKKNIAKLSSAVARSVESLSSSSASATASMSSAKVIENALNAANSGIDKERQKIRRTPPTPWATSDELLDKLFFLSISGDDPSFIAHFFSDLSPICNTSECTVGNAKAAGAYFAVTRMCNLLEQWMKDYPSDFAVPGTHGALSAFVKHLLSYSHTLSYGSDFLPFIETLPTLEDEDAEWSLKVNDFSAESDNETDSISDMVPGRLETDMESPTTPLSQIPRCSASEPASSPRTAARERRSSLPLSAMALIKAPILSSVWYQRTDEQSKPSVKDIVTKLQRTAAALSQHEADAIANEITRRESELFLKIQRRDWLRHTLIPGKKDPKSDPIAHFSSNYNELHEWAVSLILSHDKPKGRARQIEKFAEVAIRLRTLNNYSGLRAIITAINQATYPGDQSMELFKAKAELHKRFLSSDILLRTTGAHQSYRMALKNTKGPCIPSVEVHTSDLRRANEGNPDTKPDDPSKINWAKYSMIENKNIGQLLDVPAMGYEMQQNRIAQPVDDDSLPAGLGASNISIGGHSKEGSVIKRFFNGSLYSLRLKNDDGPPGNDSPYIFGFARHLAKDLGWDVKVVIPSSQKSWIGASALRKAYHIKEITKGRYYYPRDPDGTGEASILSRPLKDGEFAEWILLDGTPATCANVALHNLYKDAIDLVISGPNFGRNSSAAFALSSGTIGAALSSSLSHCRSVAVSYGTIQRPVPRQLYEPAHRLSCQIIQGLWRDWGADAGSMRNGEIDLYNINIPMVDSLLDKEGMRVVWTTIWRNAYGRLFQAHKLDPLAKADTTPAGGPDAKLSTRKEDPAGRLETFSISSPTASSSGYSTTTSDTVAYAPELVFTFAPDMRGLIGPGTAAPVGTDTWAIERGWASVTPLRASFAEPPVLSAGGDDVLRHEVGDDSGVRLLKL
ncbi:hypothetical protein EW145_g2199 [Phellinidium pouzarii]|uniref:Ras-GEF domain-containing protein n=1 Tax=Phellinidium pouzarii TaxID=167371 RepID=A0A4S4LCB8_9AGAM|nr:hypothetical protein EW145_g2199 [Phellinidium pouzarii]